MIIVEYWNLISCQGIEHNAIWGKIIAQIQIQVHIIIIIQIKRMFMY